MVERRRLDDVDDGHQVLVLQVPQQFDLTAHALRVDEVVKRLADLLHRHAHTRALVHARDDDAVCAMPDRLDELVPRGQAVGRPVDGEDPRSRGRRMQRQLVERGRRRARPL